MRVLAALAVLIVAAVLVGPLASPAAAQNTPADEQYRARVRERLRALKTARLIEVMDLDRATAQKLFPVLDRFEDEIAAVRADSGEARRNLQALLDAGKTDDPLLDRLVDRVAANQVKIHKLQDDRLREIRKVLTPAQAARLVVVLPEVENMVEKIIRRATRKPTSVPGR